MRVLIVGGGIGGLALAGGLAGSGSAGEVEVLESGAALRTSGAALTLYSNGLAALAQLGAPLPERLGGRIDLLRIHDERGRRLIGFDLNEVSCGEHSEGIDAIVGARVLYKLCNYMVAG